MCKFKPAEHGALLPQASFSLPKFEEGKHTVNISFSVKGLNFTSDIKLYKYIELQCIWKGMIVDTNYIPNKCGNLTVNTVKDQLDYTFQYTREGSEEIANFHIENELSIIGISVYWTKEGPSPDMIECQSGF